MRKASHKVRESEQVEQDIAELRGATKAKAEANKSRAEKRKVARKQLESQTKHRHR